MNLTKKAITSDKNSKPYVPALLVENIPSELKQVDKWVVWKWQWRPKRNCWDKPPCSAITGTAPGWQNNLAPFSRALELQSSGAFDGVGFVFQDAGKLVGIDLDDCRDPETGQIDPWALGVIATVNSYTEVSPSGTGVKIVAKIDSLPGSKTTDLKVGVEIYHASNTKTRYFTITGRHLETTPKTVEYRQEEVAAVYKIYLGPEEDYQKSAEPSIYELGMAPDLRVVEEALQYIGEEYYNHYPGWAKIGMALKSLGSAGFDLWLDWSKQSATKFQSREDCLKAWEAFKGEGLTIGTVYHLAKEGGWTCDKTQRAWSLAKENYHTTKQERNKQELEYRADFEQRYSKGELTPAEIAFECLKRKADKYVQNKQRKQIEKLEDQFKSQVEVIDDFRDKYDAQKTIIKSMRKEIN